MTRQGLKLKQASSVLRIDHKKLENLIQYGVIRPPQSEGTYFFDANALMLAKVASYLQESLGTGTFVLSKLVEAFSAAEEQLRSDNPEYIVFACRLTAQEEPIKLGVPFRTFREQIEERMSRTDLQQDLPSGTQRRRGWIPKPLTDAAKDIGEVFKGVVSDLAGGSRRE